MSTIIALSQSSGTAKTTLVHNLSYHLAQRQHRVLAIDMDPQASLTVFMGLLPGELQKTVYHALIEQAPLPIHEDIYGVDLVPANICLSLAAKQLLPELAAADRLEAAMLPILDEYDFILIDCPSSLGVLSGLSLTAATHVLVPIETHYQAIQGTHLLLDTVRQVRRKLNPNLQIAGFVPTRYDTRKTQDKGKLKAIQAELASVGQLFNPIPITTAFATAFADAAEQHQPLAKDDPCHPAIALLDNLTDALQPLALQTC